MLFGSFVGAVDAGPASSPYPRSRHAAQHHVTLPTSDPNGIVNFDDAIVVIESDGQRGVALIGARVTLSWGFFVGGFFVGDGGLGDHESLLRTGGLA